MVGKLIGAIAICTCLLGILQPAIVSAHQTIQIGDYNLEYGWLNEPAIEGQPNAVVINISAKQGGAGTPAGSETSQPSQNIDVSGMKIAASYGGQVKVLQLQPLGENTPGRYIAPLTPTRAGVYTIQLSGSLGGTPVDASVQPEEVQTADTVEFPSLNGETTSAPAAGNGSTDWIGIAALILGAIGTILGVIALIRRPSAH